MSGETPNSDSIPNHVCIIMDGNGRWAQKRLMPRALGHRKGVETVRTAIEVFSSAGVKHLTLFAFSSENWGRVAAEVKSLMALFLESLQKNSAELHDQNVRLRFMGDRSRFSPTLLTQMDSAEALTCGNQALNLNIAVNYGGRWDLVTALQKIAHKVALGEVAAADVDQHLLESELSLSDTPAPDLLIRTGGEHRLSNFMIWQLAYSELLFTSVLWPDFSREQMLAALTEYAARQRRYGRTSDQLEDCQTC